MTQAEGTKRTAADVRAEAAQFRAKAENDRKRAASRSDAGWHSLYSATAASYDRFASELDAIASMIEQFEAERMKNTGSRMDDR